MSIFEWQYTLMERLKHGKIHEYINSHNLDIEKYVKDKEHGIFHGLMACYVLFIVSKSPSDQTIASVLLHDLMRGSGASPVETHDVDLFKVCPRLLETTYRHSHPNDADENSFVVICDRIELRRYSDYKTWVDSRYDKLIRSLDDNTRNILDNFYLHIRPYLLQHFLDDDNCMLSNVSHMIINMLQDKHITTNR